MKVNIPRSGVLIAFLWTCVAAALVTVVLQVIKVEPFTQHLRSVTASSSFWLAAALLAAAFAVAFRERDWRTFLAFVVAALLFLRLHGVDLPLLLAALKVAGTIALGETIRRGLAGVTGCVSSPLLKWPASLVLGIAATPIVAAVLSVAGLFTPTAMAVFDALCVALAGIVLARDIGKRGLRPLLPSVELVTSTAPLVALVCIAAARTNTFLYSDSDSFWYGYSTEFSLAPDGSLFGPTGLANPVHYYPKLTEVLQFSLAGIQDPSYQASFNVVLAFLIGLVVLQALAGSGWPGRAAGTIAALIVSAPAFGHVTPSAKADLLALLMMSVGFLYLVEYSRARANAALGVSVAALMLAGASKTIYAVYVGLPVIVLGVTVLWNAFTDSRGRWASLLPILIAAVAVFLITLRTIILTGFPMVGPLALIDLWLALGFAPTDSPAIYEMDLAGDLHAPALSRVIDMLFFPYKMPHIWLTWPSYVFPILSGILLFGLDLKKFKLDIGSVLALIILSYVALLVSSFFLFGDFLVYGGDGNYFIAGNIALAFLLCLAPPRENLKPRESIGLPIAVLVPINFLVMVVATWGPGLGQTDWSLTANTFDGPATQDWWFKQMELDSVANVLSNSDSCRLFLVYGTDREWIYQLPCRVETLVDARWPVRGRPSVFKSDEAMKSYLCFARPNFVLNEGTNKVWTSFAAKYESLMTPISLNGRWQLWSFDATRLCGTMGQQFR